jgi:tRNA(Ile)-lysidine synthase
VRERIFNYIRKHELMRPGDRVGVAVSGGADSVALLRLLLELRPELGITVSVVHFNHKIRGSEGDEDEKFVRRLAQAFDLEFQCESADTPSFAGEHKISLEAAGRRLRYGFFGRLMSLPWRPRAAATLEISESTCGSPGEAPGPTKRDLDHNQQAPGPANYGLDSIQQPGPTNFGLDRGQRALGAARNFLDRVATAHTRDDQAETVLMRFLRGSGTKGLAGIYPGIGGWSGASVVTAVRKVDEAATAVPPYPATPPAPRIVRPLLEVSREELGAYLRQLGQSWREDATNADVSFTRNRLRHELMPLLRQLNPNLDEVLAQTAEIARAEEAYWEREVGQRLAKVGGPAMTVDKRPTSAQDGQMWGTTPAIRVDRLLAEPAAWQRRLVRAVAEQHELRLEFDHVEEVLAMARAEASAAKIKVELPQGWEAVRQERELWFRKRCQESQQHDYDIALPAGGEVAVAGKKIRASVVRGEELKHGSESRATDALLDPKLAEQGLRVRNWRAGDRYWPAHTQQPKKVKELLQAKHIPRAYKAMWPVVVSPTSAKTGQMWGTSERGREEIVWVPGFAAPERFQVLEGSKEALRLEVVDGSW